VALLQADDPSGALASLEDAEQVFQLAGDQKRLALTIGNRAAALDALKRFDEALQSYEACAKLLKELGEHEQRAVVLQAASKIYYRRGKPLEALAVMRAGVGSLPHPNFRQRLLQKLLELPFSMLRGKK
jgi:tetratricopeptide (TPR) repeat protein